MSRTSIELSTLDHASTAPSRAPSTRSTTALEDDVGHDEQPPEGKEAFDSYPEWRAWKQLVACFLLFFTSLGGVYSWGVFQGALVRAGLAPSSTLAFIGATLAAMQAIFAIPSARLVSAYGPRRMALIGTSLVGSGPVLASFCTHSVAGLVVTEGFMYGIGQALLFCCGATLPSAYFLKSRNVATGFVYSGAGIGGAGFSLATAQLLKRLNSLPWTFRTVALIMTVINVPASLVLRGRAERRPLRLGKRRGEAEGERKEKYFDWTMFRDPRFCLILAGTAIAVFPLFVPPFFLPLYGTSIGLSATTASYILAGFNLSSALGRICFGLGADRLLGSLNSLVVCLAMVAVSTLLVWPFAEHLGPLIAFAMINGVCAGGMFSLIPGTLSSVFGSRKLPAIFSFIITSYSFGYFLGAPIAGFLLQAYGGPDKGPEAYKPAIFYAGGVSVVATLLVAGARVLVTRQVFRKV
ncbi:hypothetical protein JCM10049v2_007347 [Rhodotorula toruloides]